MSQHTTNTWSSGLLFAQDGPPLSGATSSGTATTGGDAGGTPAGAPPGGDMNFLFMMIIPLILVMLIFTTFGSRREKKKREQMLASMKKHDRVRTIGGVIGSVVELKPETVVLKVDESSNTRMTFAREAISQILEAEAT
jgi:preprotein translocase subunit YajC